MTISQLVPFEGRWGGSFPAEHQRQAISALESGDVLFFPQLPFSLEENEQKFLSSSYADEKSKNISFDPKTQLMRGARCSDKEYPQLQEMLSRYARNAQQLIHALFPAYLSTLQWGRTSYRPVEILGRESSYRKDDTRLHVDAFPATPNQGRRLLRVFTNIHPDEKVRAWRLGENFESVAKTFLPKVRMPVWGSAWCLEKLKLTKGRRTAYDHIMLQIHDHMKADMYYQKTVAQTHVDFPKGSSWIVQTDQVSHAAMSGQFVLEQTFYLPVESMENPSTSPLQTLERLLGRPLNF